MSFPRAERADKQRNRERLLGAALRVFADDGATSPSLEAVAREAGVGIGTLYRHFPTREDLLEALYRSELERLCDQAGPLLEDHPADVALRRWMDRYADFVATKRGMGETLRTVIASGAITSAQTRQRLAGAVALLLGAGDAESGGDGTLRADVRPEDVVAGLAGVVLAAGGDDPAAQTERLLDLLVDGLRTRRR